MNSWVCLGANKSFCMQVYDPVIRLLKRFIKLENSTRNQFSEYSYNGNTLRFDGWKRMSMFHQRILIIRFSHISLHTEALSTRRWGIRSAQGMKPPSFPTCPPAHPFQFTGKTIPRPWCQVGSAVGFQQCLRVTFSASSLHFLIFWASQRTIYFGTFSIMDWQGVESQLNWASSKQFVCP